MKVFISYNRKDTYYRRKVENILASHNVDYYVVPEDADFNGWSHQKIFDFIAENMKDCDVLLCLIGKDTYKRPHVDREIHTALKGQPGVRKGIVAVFLPTRDDDYEDIDYNNYSAKLSDNEDYVVECNYMDLNNYVVNFINEAYKRSLDKRYQTSHKNKCLKFRNKKYYDQ